MEKLQGGFVSISGVLGPQLKRAQGSRCPRPSLCVLFLKGRAERGHSLEQPVPANCCQRLSIQNGGQDRQAARGP